MEDKKAKFMRIFANIPENLRGDILVIANKKPYTWNSSYIEIKNDTALGRKILKTLEDMNIL